MTGRRRVIAVTFFAISFAGGTTVAILGSRQPSDPARLVGVALPGGSSPQLGMVRDSLETRGRELGLSLEVRDAGGLVETQLAQIDELLALHVQVLIVGAVDPDRLAPVLEHAATAKVPVVSVDDLAGAGAIAVRIRSDDVAGGRLAGDFLLRQLGGVGGVLEFTGPISSTVTSRRDRGFRSAIEANPEIRLTQRGLPTLARESARQAVGELLASGQVIDAIFAPDDAPALGAFDAVRDAGLTDRIIVVGFGGTPDAIDSIAAGGLTATISQEPDRQGRIAAEAADALLRGQPVEPLIGIDVVLVTRDNVDIYQ